MTKKLDARNIHDKITINLGVFCSIMRELRRRVYIHKDGKVSLHNLKGKRTKADLGFYPYRQEEVMAEKQCCFICGEEMIANDGWAIYDDGGVEGRPHIPEQYRVCHPHCWILGNDLFLGDVTERFQEVLDMLADAVDDFREDPDWDFDCHESLARGVRIGMAKLEGAIKRVEEAENKIRQENGDEPIDRTQIPPKRVTFLDENDPTGGSDGKEIHEAPVLR